MPGPSPRALCILAIVEAVLAANLVTTLKKLGVLAGTMWSQHYTKHVAPGILAFQDPQLAYPRSLAARTTLTDPSDMPFQPEIQSPYARAKQSFFSTIY